MKTLASLTVLLALSLSMVACGGSSSSQEPAPRSADGEPAASGGESSERPLLSADECTQRGGTVVGDIGDGATLRPDYLCANGVAPIGNVPLGIEGSVCCGQ